ncbi:MAG: phosphate ABC transporter permease family protein, partial [Rhodobiaceae bacterium]|nr:phosphate ABC transporter permease family protein [Rhodobiaceae bacterium]
MSTGMLILALVIIFPLAMFVGRTRAGVLNRGSQRLHSRPVYHGVYLALMAILPALFVIVVWGVAEPLIINNSARGELPQTVLDLPVAEQNLVMGVINNLADGYNRLSDDELAQMRAGADGTQRMLAAKGIFLPSAPEPFMVDVAEHMASAKMTSRLLAALVSAVAAILGFFIGWRRIAPAMRARNIVERMMLIGLLAASGVAILTTFGIVMSVLFESIHFFSIVPVTDFLFGTVWDPRFSAPGREGAGQFGILPLLWGTLFISFVAMLVAVPVGLFSAIYMSEYASSRLRAFAKPVLEVLAGIPTIVYG